MRCIYQPNCMLRTSGMESTPCLSPLTSVQRRIILARLPTQVTTELLVQWPWGEPDAGYSRTLHAGLMQGAVHPALYVQTDETSAVRAKLADLQEVMRTWYIAFYTRSQ